jgi:hypothetical protein
VVITTSDDDVLDVDALEDGLLESEDDARWAARTTRLVVVPPRGVPPARALALSSLAVAVPLL